MKNQPVIEACRKFGFRNTPETLRYFYHPDHIGSTSWVTDSAKNGIQYCEYLPFGEPFIDQRSTTWNSRYTFSGKERDGETGYSYFGARYYNSDISIWLSVDPMADKYPNLTPYAYCANNPIVLVDPDGREIRIYYKNKTGIARLFEKPKYIVYTPGMQYNGNNAFVKGTVEALNYVLKADKLSIISTIVNDKKIAKIKETAIGEDRYNVISNTIYYNNQSGLICLDKNGEPTAGKQSPALGLLHELGHTFVDFFKSRKEKAELNVFDPNYDSKEEKFVIENVETPAAKKLNEGIRDNHNGESYKTKHSTTTEAE